MQRAAFGTDVAGALCMGLSDCQRCAVAAAGDCLGLQPCFVSLALACS